jgi:hypothetical protein
MVMLSFDGVPGLFIARPWGLLASQFTFRVVYFSEPSCTGDPFLNEPIDAGLEEMTNTAFAVLGPDPDMGTYRVFRSTSTQPANTPVLSYQVPNDVCHDDAASRVLVTAEEVLPNPLDGFHGPTTANPERVWTITGGDRIQ